MRLDHQAAGDVNGDRFGDFWRDLGRLTLSRVEPLHGAFSKGCLQMLHRNLFFSQCCFWGLLLL